MAGATHLRCAAALVLLTLAITLLAACSSDAAECPSEYFYPSEGDACEAEGLVCNIENYGECIQRPTSEHVSAVATCIKDHWHVETMGRCTNPRPTGGTGGSRPSGSGGIGGAGGQPTNDLDAGDEEDAGH